MEIVGIERVEYTSKKTGNLVKGYRFYFTEKRNRVEGLATFDCFCTDRGVVFLDDHSDLSMYIGAEAHLIYNRYGNVEEIELLK